MQGGNTGGITGGITESEIANYLAHTPAFFERHADLLATVQLTSPHGQRAVSLQQRQMEMLRDKVKGLEQHIMDMVRHGRDNVAIADRLHRFTRVLLLAATPGGLPQDLVASLRKEFLIPQAALRLWDTDPAFDGLPFTLGVTDDVRDLANSLALPYCGLNTGFDAVGWLDDPGTVMSTALIPLRGAALGAPPGAAAGAGTGNAFGLLVLGSPDPTRYSADMGTEFLMRIGEMAGAALTRLLPRQPQAGAPDDSSHR